MTALGGRRLLIVEDEILIALYLRDILQELGCVVVAITGEPEEALRHIDAYRGALDAATLDINLGHTTSHDIATALDARGIPLVITTGYHDARHLAGLERYPRVVKPYHPGDIERALRSLNWRE